ncbi:DUF998 domain-containing protein [Flavobacterium sp.]|uniref:DUF998 domain-containing protein n=1 Tax=Flavobacterium sp. TaxID=239 RepID=UPI00286DCBDE|nr:DUF998 domain-containing protein [Flavobacterium sp.]
MNNLKISGALFFLAGSLILMGIITSEAFYPSGYNTANSEISDLGATVPPNSVSYLPSATIFNTAMWLSGFMILVASFCQHFHFKKIIFTIPAALLAIGLLGVGFFPGDKVPYHGMFSLLTFTSGGLAAILSFKITAAPFKYFAFVFGLITLVVLFTAQTYIPIIGDGGTERWVAYPVVLWLVGIGGFLLNEKSSPI